MPTKQTIEDLHAAMLETRAAMHAAEDAYKKTLEYKAYLKACDVKMTAFVAYSRAVDLAEGLSK